MDGFLLFVCVAVTKPTQYYKQHLRSHITLGSHVCGCVCVRSSRITSAYNNNNTTKKRTSQPRNRTMCGGGEGNPNGKHKSKTRTGSAINPILRSHVRSRVCRCTVNNKRTVMGHRFLSLCVWVCTMWQMRPFDGQHISTGARRDYVGFGAHKCQTARPPVQAVNRSY